MQDMGVRYCIFFTMIAMLLSSCATVGDGDKTMKGAGIGTLGGAAAGALIGAMAGNPAKGAWIGAATGAAVGTVTGVVLDKQEHNIVGQVTADGELNLNFENLARWVEPSFESDSVCQKCSLLSTCQGIACPLGRIQNNVRPCAATPKTRLRNELLLALETADLKSQEIRINAK